MSLDFDSIALVTVLLQKDTLKEIPESDRKQIETVLQKQKILVEKFRNANAPIVHCIRITLANHHNVDYWRKERYSDHYLISSEGYHLLSEVVGENSAFHIQKNVNSLIDGHILEVQPNELVMYQPRLGAFYFTGLCEFLEQNKITTLAFCGLNFPVSTLPSLLEACERDFKLLFPLDANLGARKEDLERLKYLEVTKLPVQEIELPKSLITRVKDTNFTLFSKLEYTLGPIIGGFFLDSVSYSTAGFEGFFTQIGIRGMSTPLGFVLGLNVGYWLCRIYRMPFFKSIGLAILAGLYCCLPSLSNIPLAMMLTAYFRFSSPRFRT